MNFWGHRVPGHHPVSLRSAATKAPSTDDPHRCGCSHRPQRVVMGAGWTGRTPGSRAGARGANGQMHTPTTVPGRSAAPRSTRCRADHVTGLSYAVIVMWAFSAVGGAGLSARSAAQAGLLNGTRSPCVLHTICGRPALAEVTYCQKAPDGRGPDAAGEIRVQVGLGNQLEQPGAHQAVLDARGEPACGRCRSPDSAPGRSRPMRDGERCNGRNRS